MVDITYFKIQEDGNQIKNQSYFKISVVFLYGVAVSMKALILLGHLL